MNQASLYQRANHVQRHDARRVLEEYGSVIQWRPDGRDRLLDVGCGSGNVLMDFVYPRLPPTFEQLVGTDISAQMVAYARRVYAQRERAEFQVLDIGADAVPKQLRGRFDHVTSFYCLHWVQNHKNALQNIHQMLRSSGGDCLLVFLAKNPIFEVYKTLTRLPKWAGYMQDVERFISPLHHSEDPRREFLQLLEEAGFVDCRVEVRDEVFVYEGVANMRDNVKAVCPFLDRIPAAQHEEFLDDCVNTVVSMKLREAAADATDYRFISPYKLVVAYARRSGGFAETVIGAEPKAGKSAN